MMRGHFFFAKILLFGEYGIIKDCRGLSIPYNFFKDSPFAEEENDITRASHKNLYDYTQYLKGLPLIWFY